MTTLMIAAAALAVAAGSASAQTFKAEVPLTFRAGETLMQPGAYQVKVTLSDSGVQRIYLRNADTKKAIFLLASPGKDAPAKWRAAGKPMMSFACSDDRCALRSIWVGGDRETANIPGATQKSDRHLAEVTVALTEE